MEKAISYRERTGCRGKGFAWKGLLPILTFLALFMPLAAAEAGQHSLPQLPPELEAVRAKFEKYQDPLAAVRDGYWSTLGCVIYPDGNMGIHFVNARLIGPVPDAGSPQILLYEPVGGKLRLVGVEWFIPLSTGVKGRPEIFGHRFEGPMEGHYPVLPLELHHYDLHVWLFKANPAGLFSHSNPDVDCDSPWGYPIVEKVAKIVPHK